MTTTEKPGKPALTPLGFEIPSLAARWAAAVQEHGGYDPEKGVFTPLRNVAMLDGKGQRLSTWYAAEAICAAYEEGLLTEENLRSAFATPKDAEALVDFFVDNNEGWVHERHYNAWMGLGAGEEEAATFDLLADYIRDNVLAEME